MKKKPLVAIFIAILINLIGFAIVVPYEATYARDVVGAPADLIGPLVGSFYFACVLASPIVGTLLDRFGRRPVILGGMLLSAISYALFAASSNVAMLFIARILDGFTGSNVISARAYIADVTEPKKRAEGLALLGIAYGIAFIIGPAAFLKGLLAVGPRAPIWGSAACSAAAFVFAAVALPETYGEKELRVNPLKAVAELAKRPNIRHLALVVICYWAAFSAFYSSVMVFVAPKFHKTPDEVGPLVGALGLAGVISYSPLVVGNAVKKLGERRTLVLGLFLSAIGFGIASQVDVLALFMVCGVIGSVGIGLAGPSCASLISRSGTPEEQGRLAGGLGAVEYFSRGAGPIGGFALLNAFEGGAVFIGLACVMALGGVIAWFYKSPSEQSASLGVTAAATPATAD